MEVVNVDTYYFDTFEEEENGFFTVDLISNKQITSIVYSGYPHYQVDFELNMKYAFRMKVNKSDKVRDLMNNVFQELEDGMMLHADLRVYCPDGSYFELDQNDSWEENGITGYVTVVRMSSNYEKAAAA